MRCIWGAAFVVGKALWARTKASWMSLSVCLVRWARPVSLLATFSSVCVCVCVRVKLEPTSSTAYPCKFGSRLRSTIVDRQNGMRTRVEILHKWLSLVVEVVRSLWSVGRPSCLFLTCLHTDNLESTYVCMYVCCLCLCLCKCMCMYVACACVCMCMCMYVLKLCR